MGFIKSEISGKKVLLIATAFFGYEEKMKRQMLELGAIVDFYDERCIKHNWEKALLKVRPQLFRKKLDSYYAQIIITNKKDYEHVFIYGATMMEPHHLDMLKKAYNKAVFTLYLADTIIGNKRYESLFQYFDRIYTFDYRDWMHYKEITSKVYFLPLFYSSDYENRKTLPDAKYDLTFIGTIHSDRLSFLEKVKKQAEEKGYNTFFYYYLPGHFMYFFYWFKNKEFRKKRIGDFKYKKLTSQEIRDIILNSKAVIDIQHPNNTGLTMRTIETLGMNRKIMTTNDDIKLYDFYNNNNVMILDRKNPKLTNEFFLAEHVELDEKIYCKYSLANWILYQMRSSVSNKNNFFSLERYSSDEV